jgi:hypothetical protein
VSSDIKKEKKYNNKQKENTTNVKKYSYDFSFNFPHVFAPKALAK